jgi:uncharacterized protein YdaU (DUF1376 family)
MSQAPSMPMYWDAYLADTTHLTTEEHGAYMLLLAAMWRRNGSIPEDDSDIARILGMTKGKWAKTKARLAGFLIFENGEISQKKLQKLWKNTQEKIEKNRANGAKGGRPVSSKNNDLAKANGSVSDNPIKTIPEPEPEPEVREDTNVSLSAEPTLPAVAKDAGPSFSDFWAVWPLGKICKQAAEKAWRKLSVADRALATDRAQVWSAHWRHNHPQASPIHPASYLNGKRWTDEIQPTLTLIPGGPREPSRQDQRSAARSDATARQIAFAARAIKTSDGDCF